MNNITKTSLITSFENISYSRKKISCQQLHHLLTDFDRDVLTLLDFTLENRKIVIMDDTILLTTCEQKLQKILREVGIFNTINDKKIPISFREKSDAFIKKLAKTILADRNNDNAFEAQHILLKLEKIDPSLEPLNNSIQKLLTSFYLDELIKARKEVTNYVKNRSLTQFKMPVRPYVKSHLAKDYTSFDIAQKINTNISEKEKAFWKVKTILVGHNLQSDRFDTLDFKNLHDIGAIEGFNVIASKVTKWLRDPVCILDATQFLAPPVFEKKFYRFILETALFTCQNTATVREISGLYSNEKIAPFYFEGGNLLTATNMNGERVFLTGSDNILYSILNSYQFIKSEEMQSALVEEMGSIDKSTGFANEALNSARKFLNKSTLLDNFSSEEEKLKITKLFITSINYYKRTMEKSLEAKVHIVGDVFEGQPDFHLDLFICPAPGGIIFIQDYGLVINVIDELLKNHKLKVLDFYQLNAYRRQATRGLTLFQNKLQKIRNALSEEGFHIVPVPGNFQTKKKFWSINFINGLSGVGERGNFLITNGSKNIVDKHLRDAFSDIVKGHGIDNLYFVGRSIEGNVLNDPRLTFNAADINLKQNGGIHCRTQVLNGSNETFQFVSNESKSGEQKNRQETNFKNEICSFYKKMLKL